MRDKLYWIGFIVIIILGMPLFFLKPIEHPFIHGLIIGSIYALGNLIGKIEARYENRR